MSLDRAGTGIDDDLAFGAQESGDRTSRVILPGLPGQNSYDIHLPDVPVGADGRDVAPVNLAMRTVR